ncbi:hypothetical protein [Micromonospora sp. NPDC050276]
MRDIAGTVACIDGNTFMVSDEDYAVAVIDEVEQPQHRQRRFAVAY